MRALSRSLLTTVFSEDYKPNPFCMFPSENCLVNVLFIHALPYKLICLGISISQVFYNLKRYEVKTCESVNPAHLSCSAFLLLLHTKTARALTPIALSPALVPSLQITLLATYFCIPLPCWSLLFPLDSSSWSYFPAYLPFYLSTKISLQSSSITSTPYHKQFSPSGTQLSNPLFQMTECLR